MNNNTIALKCYKQICLTLNPVNMLAVYRFFLIAVLFISMHGNCLSQNFDISLLRKINSNETVFKNDFCKVSSNSVTIINVAAPCTILATGIITHDKKLQADAVFMAGSFIVSSVVTHAGKRLVKHCRPFETYPDIVKRGAGGGYSFPSGHTSAAFTTATSLSLNFPRWYVVVPSYLWASGVAYARMYQGVHYPGDVIAGALVGAGSAFLGWKLEQKMFRKTGKLKIRL